MQARTLTATDGWRWLGRGFALFRRNPALLTLLMLAYWLMLLSVSQLPTVGWPLANILIPAFSVSLMSACRNLEQSRLLDFAVLLSGFRRQLRPLLILGSLYFAAFLLALAASSIADGGLFFETMLGQHRATEEEIAQGVFLVPMQIMMLTLLPAMMATWFAPVLIAWHDFGVGKALFFSFVACVRNWLPFLTYGLCALLFGGIFPTLLFILLLSVGGVAPEFAFGMAMLPVVFIYAPSVIASFYVSYRDIFADGEAPRIDEEA